jgi:hypothetical protein
MKVAMNFSPATPFFSNHFSGSFITKCRFWLSFLLTHILPSVALFHFTSDLGEVNCFSFNGSSRSRFDLSVKICVLLRHIRSTLNVATLAIITFCRSLNGHSIYINILQIFVIICVNCNRRLQQLVA